MKPKDTTVSKEGKPFASQPMLKLNSPVAYIIFAIILIPSWSIGQEAVSITFDRLTTENIIKVKGLSQNSIYSMIRDSEGYMWFGTWDGLNKYDAYTFSIYRIENGLSHNTARSLLEDSRGYLWIGTDNGLNRLNRTTGEITIFRNDPGDLNSLCANYVNAIMEDGDSNLWIGTSAGICIYNPRIRIFSGIDLHGHPKANDKSSFITKMVRGEDGSIWIATYLGIFRIGAMTGQRRHYLFVDTASLQTEVNANTIHDMIFSSDGQLWVATAAGIYLHDPASGISYPFRLKNREEPMHGKTVQAIIEDNTGLIWIGTSDGLYIYSPVSGKLSQFRASSTPSSLSNNDVRSIYQDPSGTIWIGTYSGLNKVDRSPSRFTHYFRLPDDPSSLSDNIVYAILEDQDERIWIGTFDGINILDRKAGKNVVMRHDPGNDNSLSGNKIRNIIKDSHGDFWIGTELNGLNRYNPRSGRFRHYFHDPGDPWSIPDNNIYALLEDSKGRIWVGTPGGLCFYDRDDDSFHPPTDPDSQPVRLSGELVWSVNEDSKGNIWVCTTQGLNIFSPDFGRQTIFHHEPENTGSLNNNSVFSIYEDKEGIFWIGTMGGGLNRYDPKTGLFKAYTDQNGLPNNVVYGLLEDKNGSLWLSTNGGLCKFIREDETFITYDAKDGVQGNEFNMGAYYQSGSGELFFGGMNGFNSFFPEDIRINATPPKIVFTSLKIFNEKINLRFDDGDTLVLKPSEDIFTIGFSALDYTNPSKNWYRYKLEGYDRDWIVMDASRRWVDYTMVKPGTYTFRVSGTNNDGVWNPDGISLVVVIQPPWYASWIFRIGTSLFVILLLWGFIYIRFRSIRKKHEVEKRMLNVEKQIFELEQKALRLQMNPHFIFNSLNAIQNFVISNDTDKAVNYLAKFSHLMRMILANSSASYIPLKDELKALTHYMDLEKLRFDDKFNYYIEIDPRIDQEFTEIPPMLFQPFVENAIIHGLVHSDKPGRLELKLHLRKESLICTIQDNGIGREKAQKIREQSGIKRPPKGMIITRERLEILNKQSGKLFAVKVNDLKDENGKAAGTKVEITIQYKGA